MIDLKVNSHYNFSLYDNSVLGSSYNGVRLGSILDYRTALKFGNVELIQRQIFPYLPPGTNKDHSKYTYYLFYKGDTEVVVAREWMIEDSINQAIGTDYTIVLKSVTSDKVAIIRDQLRLLGISFDIL